MLVKPRDFRILPEISWLTSITNEMVLDKPYFDHAAKQFIEWYGSRNKSILSGWGLYYDLPLLRKEFRSFGLDYNEYFVGGGLDVKTLGYYWLARNGFSTTNVTIEKLLEEMKIETAFKLHRALDDARATALIFQNIMRQEG